MVKELKPKLDKNKDKLGGEKNVDKKARFLQTYADVCKKQIVNKYSKV